MQFDKSAGDWITSTIESVKQVIPVVTDIQNPDVFNSSVIHSEIGVLVGVTGDILGRIVIKGDFQTFSKLGESLYGMPLEGEMLQSFVGETANMIAGNTSTFLFQKGHKVDITPPTVVMGQLQMFGFESGIIVPFDFPNIGQLNIILFLQNQAA